MGRSRFSRRFWWVAACGLWVLVVLGLLLEGKFFPATTTVALVITAFNLLGDDEGKRWVIRFSIPYEVLYAILLLAGLVGMFLAGLAWFR